MRDALQILRDRLQENDISWLLTGSGHLALAGMDVNPEDLDIAVQYEDLERIPGVFPQYSFSDIKPLKGDDEGGAVQSYIGDVEVEFIGESSHGVYMKRMGETQYLTCDHMQIPVLTLKAEAAAYEEMGRTEKANMIYDFLQEETK